jgi:hypothetical protein
LFNATLLRATTTTSLERRIVMDTNSQATPFAAVLDDVRRQRDELRRGWDALLAELGNPEPPSPEDVERALRALPASEREELERFRDETDALLAAIESPPQAFDAPTFKRSAVAGHTPTFHYVIRG